MKELLMELYQNIVGSAFLRHRLSSCYCCSWF